MTTNPCLELGCVSAGLFPGAREADGGPVEGYWCFAHDPAAVDLSTPAADGPVYVVEPDRFHVDVVAGLASMILDHVAMTYADTDTASDDAMRSLSENTALSLDLAAGVLLAATAIAKAGNLDPGDITDLAAVYEAAADAEDVDEPAPRVGPDNDRDAMADEETCPTCDGSGMVGDDHDGDPLDDCPTCDGHGVVDIVGPPPNVPDDGVVETETPPGRLLDGSTAEEPTL